MKSWLALGLGVACLTAPARAEREGAYQFEPMVFAAQGFVGGGPSNLFPRAQGSYQGLLLPTNGFAANHAGDLRIVVHTFGDYTGRMKLSGNSIPLRGHFNRHGESGLYVYRRIWDDCDCFFRLRLAWIVHLQLVDGTDQIQGSVENARQGWTTEFNGYKGYVAADGPALAQGRYTLSLPGSSDPAIAPGGSGYGTLKVDRHGRLSINGRLADGVGFSQTAIISTNGWWPFYVPLSFGDGALIGWLQFTSTAGSDVAGGLMWVRPRRDDRALYPNGFSGTIAAIGSRYTAPAAASTALNWSDGILWISGGSLPAPATNSVTLQPGGKLTNNGGDIDNLTFSLTRSTGLFRGGFSHPVTGRRAAYSGVLLQLPASGEGYFLGPDQSGRVRLESVP